jgi:hypothetical protein
MTDRERTAEARRIRRQVNWLLLKALVPPALFLLAYAAFIAAVALDLLSA